MIPVWSVSGVIDAMVYHGVSLITPPFLILFAFLLSLGVSMLLGTSVGAMSTMGIAVIGLTHAFQMPVGPVAGALVSGAFVGDRTSPLSGSAHLTATMAGAPFYRGWKVIIKSLFPVFLLCLFLYAGLGIIYGDVPFRADDLAQVRRQLLAPYPFFSPWLWLPPLSVLICALFRIPVLINLAQGAILGAGIGLFLYDIPLTTLLQTAWTGAERYRHPVGGIWPMIQALGVIMSAGALYGTMQSACILDRVSQSITHSASTPEQLMRRTGLFSVAIALLTCNQTLCLMMPGKLMRRSYTEMGMTSSQLVRSISDTGMVMAGWIPWNLNALLCAAAIGVPVVQYMPFAYLLFLLPLYFFWSTRTKNTGSRNRQVSSPTPIP
ncbi:Na+/H+ antiporter NhaC family protein [Paludifilum halophilum]